MPAAGARGGTGLHILPPQNWIELDLDVFASELAKKKKLLLEPGNRWYRNIPLQPVPTPSVLGPALHQRQCAGREAGIGLRAGLEAGARHGCWDDGTADLPRARRANQQPARHCMQIRLVVVINGRIGAI